jgi:hypothetical protein
MSDIFVLCFHKMEAVMLQTHPQREGCLVTQWWVCSRNFTFPFFREFLQFDPFLKIWNALGLIWSAKTSQKMVVFCEGKVCGFPHPFMTSFPFIP